GGELQSDVGLILAHAVPFSVLDERAARKPFLTGCIRVLHDAAIRNGVPADTEGSRRAPVHRPEARPALWNRERLNDVPLGVELGIKGACDDVPVAREVHLDQRLAAEATRARDILGIVRKENLVVGDTRTDEHPLTASAIRGQEHIAKRELVDGKVLLDPAVADATRVACAANALVRDSLRTVAQARLHLPVEIGSRPLRHLVPANPLILVTLILHPGVFVIGVSKL